MDAPIPEKKMGDSGAGSASALQVSVSSGRFVNDSPSWEKCATFPPNKYLEEIKCSTAGSVAQKKAYFEAQLKNIATQKVDQESQDKKRGIKERDRVDLKDRTRRYSMSDFNAVEKELEVDKSNAQNYVNGIELECGVPNSTSEVSNCRKEETKDAVDIINESKDSVPLIEDVKGDRSCRAGSPELLKLEEPAIVKQEASSLGSQEFEESSPHLEDTRESAPKDMEEKVKTEKSLKFQKDTAVKKTTNNVPRKKPISSSPNSSVISTSKKGITSESKVLSKKENCTSPLTKKKPTRLESRKATPTSLHMSLNLNPANTEPALSTTIRKSLIMERMGDKDIVKRTFKTFQSNFNQLSSSSPTKPSPKSEILGKETDTKSSLVGTQQKKIEGGNKLVKKSSPRSGQPGPVKTTNSTRVPNTVSDNQSKNKSVPSPYGLRSHDKPASGNKVLKKLEKEVNDKRAERTQLLSKDKKESEIKRLERGHNTKAKPISGTVMSKSSL